jgi:uncharacterized membrane protein
MIDLHPPASGLPLASVLLLCAAEALSCLGRSRQAGETLRTSAVIACVVSVIAAFSSGYQASSRALSLTVEAQDAVAFHHALGKGLLATTLLLGTFYYLSRAATQGKRAFYFVYLGVLLLQLIGTIWVGTLGGRLVFEHGVNVSCQAPAS